MITPEDIGVTYDMIGGLAEVRKGERVTERKGERVRERKTERVRERKTERGRGEKRRES